MNLQRIQERLESLGEGDTRDEAVVMQIASALGHELAQPQVHHLERFSEQLSSHSTRLYQVCSELPLHLGLDALRRVSDLVAAKNNQAHVSGPLSLLHDSSVSDMFAGVNSQDIAGSDGSSPLESWGAIMNGIAESSFNRQIHVLDRLRRELAAIMQRDLPSHTKMIASTLLELTTATRDQIHHINSVQMPAVIHDRHELK